MHSCYGTALVSDSCEGLNSCAGFNADGSEVECKGQATFADAVICEAPAEGEAEL